MPLLQEPVALSLQNIFFATDFSYASEKAAAYAVGLARHFRSHLEIAHVFDLSVVTSYEEAIIPTNATERKRISGENLRNFASQRDLNGILTTVLATEGHRPSRSLLDIAGARS